MRHRDTESTENNTEFSFISVWSLCSLCLCVALNSSRSESGAIETAVAAEGREGVGRGGSRGNSGGADGAGADDVGDDQINTGGGGERADDIHDAGVGRHAGRRRGV